MKLSEELIWRGFQAETTIKDPSTLDTRESKKFYLGADPSADSLTIGNLAALMMCACFVRHGYEPTLLVGGATGQIGDPKETGERDLKSLDEVEHNKECIKRQIMKIMNIDGLDDEIVNPDFVGPVGGSAETVGASPVTTGAGDRYPRNGDSPARTTFFPIVKELAYNKCPAVAPLGVLEKSDGWQKIGITREQLEKNLKSLLSHPDFAEKMREQHENQPEWPEAPDPESALYDGFLPEGDRIRCNAVRNADATKLADFHPTFTDQRLPELLLHYKAKNYPTSLAEDEVKKWNEYRIARLTRQSSSFAKAMQDLAKLSAENKPMKNGNLPDPFLLEELSLYYQSLQNPDY